jgi:hypothetical protein
MAQVVVAVVYSPAQVEGLRQMLGVSVGAQVVAQGLVVVLEEAVIMQVVGHLMAQVVAVDGVLQGELDIIRLAEQVVKLWRLIHTQ